MWLCGGFAVTAFLCHGTGGFAVTPVVFLMAGTNAPLAP
jgi:hypothetical protein